MPDWGQERSAPLLLKVQSESMKVDWSGNMLKRHIILWLGDSIYAVHQVEFLQFSKYFRPAKYFEQ